MGSVYDRTEKEYYHNKRHRCTCRDTVILLPNCGQGQLLPDAVFLSAQLYLYRSVRRLGALRPSADRAKAGVQVYDGHHSTAHHMDGSPFGKVFYILAAGCRPLPVVSVLSAHAVCAYAGAADRHVIGKAGQSPVTMGGLTVHTMPIDGGYAVWTEDVSALRDIKEDSKLLADELADRNEMLRYEYKREAKRRKVEEQNRLYDLLRSATQTQIDRIAELTKEYRRISSTDPDSAKTLLAEIAVLCSYIKRRKHLTLLTDRDIKIAETELHRAFNESLQTLKLLGVRSSLYVDESLSMLSGKTATAVFDFYESVIEADILNLTGIQVSLIKANGLRLSLNVCCKADLSALVSGDNIRCEKEDDEEYQHLVFEAKEGDRK